MMVKKVSDYEYTVERVKSTFNDFQNSLQDLKESPLTLSSDVPHIAMWLSNKCIKTLFNVFCLPIELKMDTAIRPEDLEEFKFKLGECKMEYEEEEESQAKLEDGEANGSREGSASSSYLRQLDENDTSFQDENGVRHKRDYKRGPYKNYTVEEKITAVRMLLQNNSSVIEVSRKLHIPCKNIKRWSQYGVERKKGGGRKRFSPETEKKVAKKLKEMFKEGSEVEYQKIQEIARKMSDDPSFKASRGWVVKFVDRQSLRNYYKFS